MKKNKMDNLFYSKFTFKESMGGIPILPNDELKKARLQPKHSDEISPESQEYIKRTKFREELGIKEYNSVLEKSMRENRDFDLGSRVMKTIVDNISANLEARADFLTNVNKYKAVLKDVGIKIDRPDIQKMFAARGGEIMKRFIIKIISGDKVFSDFLLNFPTFYKNIVLTRELIASKCPRNLLNVFVLIEGAPLIVRLEIIRYCITRKETLENILNYRNQYKNTVKIGDMPRDERNSVLTAIIKHEQADADILNLVLPIARAEDLPVFRDMALSRYINETIITAMFNKSRAIKNDFWVNSYLVSNPSVKQPAIYNIVGNLKNIVPSNKRSDLAQEIKEKRMPIVQPYLAQINKVIQETRRG